MAETMLMLFLGAAVLVLLAVSKAFRAAFGVALGVGALLIAVQVFSSPAPPAPAPVRQASADECASIRNSGLPANEVELQLSAVHCVAP